MIGFDESSLLKIGGYAITGVLTDRDGRVQLDAFLHHLEQGGLLRTMIFETKTTPGEHLENVNEGRWAQVDAIAPGGDRARWPAQDVKLLCRFRDLARQDRGLPDEASIARLDGLIALVVKAPIAVEGKACEPVPLPERIGKPGVDAAGGINAN